MKNIVSWTFVFAVGFGMPARAEDLPEDKLIAAARENPEPSTLTGVQSEMERRALAEAGNFAFRKGDQLVLSVEGHTEIYVDGPTKECEPGPVLDCGGVFKLVAFAKSRNMFVLQESVTDSLSVYLAVDRTLGKETMFGEMPYLSPTGDYAVGETLLQPTGLPDNEYPEPHIQISQRYPRGVYLMDWEGAPHIPKTGVARYLIDGWRDDDPSLNVRKRAVEVYAHLEVDGKVRARFKIRRNPGKYTFKVTTIHR